MTGHISSDHGNAGVPKAKAIIKRAAALRAVPHRPGSLPPEDEGVDVTHLLAFKNRRINQECAWIPGDPLNGAMCCGQPVVEGTQWCSEHHARVYAGRPE